MKAREIQIIGSTLSVRLGWSWPLVVLKALHTKNVLFSQSRWAKTRGPESQFVNLRL
jgi:hypothetical protein